jgi:type IV pilus assembly protein PilF
MSLMLTACVSTSGSGRNQSGSDEKTRRVKSADINVQLAIGYLKEGRVELALDKIDRALIQDPKSSTAHSVAGVIMERIGRFEEAEEHYARSVKLEPNNGTLHNNYAQYLCKDNKIDQAMIHFNLAIEQPFYDTPEVALANACFCNYKAGRFEHAEEICRRAIDSDESYGDPYYLLSLIFLDRNEPFKARAFFQRYQSVASESAASLKMCIDIETAMKDKQTAAECAKRLRTNFPNSIEAREQSGKPDDG